MAYTFDGPNKLIILTAGTVAVEVDEMYSRWCDWLVLSDNIKYLPAIRFVGGDAISATKNLGITFFLINGWRVRPDEANHTLRVNGNLYTDPSGFSPFVPTVGAFNVTIELTVSSLVDSSLAQISEIEQSAFEGKVYVDAVSGGTDTAYPAGTPSNPVQTIALAQTIGNARGIKSLFINGDYTFSSSDVLTEWHIYGEGATLNATRTKLTFTSGNTTTGAHFHNCRIVGPQGGETNFHECIIEALSNAHCHYDWVGFLTPSSQAYTLQASNTISAGHITDLHDCYGDEGVAVIDRNGTRLNQRYIRFAGSIKFINQNRADGGASNRSGDVWINMNGGTVEIDASCTTGNFYITGNCTVINNSGGSVVDISGVIGTSAAGDPWAQTIEGSFTAAEVMRLIAAALAGTSTKAGNTITFKGIDGTTDRIVGSFDAENNRTGAVLDGS